MPDPIHFARQYMSKPHISQGTGRLRQCFSVFCRYLVDKQAHGVTWPWNAPRKFEYTSPSRRESAHDSRALENPYQIPGKTDLLTKRFGTHAGTLLNIVLPELTCLTHTYDCACLGRVYTPMPPLSPVSFGNGVGELPDRVYVRLPCAYNGGAWDFIKVWPSPQAEVYTVLDMHILIRDIPVECEGRQMFFE